MSRHVQRVTRAGRDLAVALAAFERLLRLMIVPVVNAIVMRAGVVGRFGENLLDDPLGSVAVVADSGFFFFFFSFLLYYTCLARLGANLTYACRDRYAHTHTHIYTQLKLHLVRVWLHLIVALNTTKVNLYFSSFRRRCCLSIFFFFFFFFFFFRLRIKYAA